MAQITPIYTTVSGVGTRVRGNGETRGEELMVITYYQLSMPNAQSPIPIIT